MTDVTKNIKTPIINNIIVPMPEPKDIGTIILNLREGAELSQRELSQKLKMRGRSSISEYEHNLITVSKQTFALIAILTDSHPMKKGEGELVFDVNPKPEEGYKAFVENALKKQGITAEELVKNKAKALKLEVETVNKVLNDEKPKDKEWSNIQLALGEYASGFNYAEIINRERNKHGWEQSEVAALVGITGQSISNYENRRSIPGAHIWAVLLLVFGIHPNYTMLKKEISDNYLKELAEKIKSIKSVREEELMS